MLTWISGSVSGHKISDTNAQLLFDYFVSQCQLLLQMIYIVVSLLYVKLRTVFLPLKVDLLQIKQVLIVLHIDLLYLLLQHFRLIVFNEFVSLLL